MSTQFINPVALAMLFVACVVVVTSTGQRALNAVMLVALLAPSGQMFIIGGLHVRYLPIIILIALIRVIVRHEISSLGLISTDKIFLAICFISLAFTTMRKPTAESFGDCFTSAGGYIVFRALTQDSEDVVAALRFLALLGIVIGSVMIFEYITHRNPFAVLGGVSAVDGLRFGHARCQGAFRNNLNAGAFGASLMPLMVALWLHEGGHRARAALGIIASGVITFTAVSSGAILTFLAAIFGICLWPFRHRMKLFRRGLVAALIALHIVMKVPVWYLLAKASDLFGGSGWHRSFLIDQFFRYFNEWWLIGTSRTAHWGPSGQVIAGDTDMMDITNHYIAQALEGGLLGLILFICLLVSCFRIIGRLMDADGCGTLNAKTIWMLGVTHAAHCVAFFSIWYYDQIITYWTWFAAATASLAVIHSRLQAQPAAEEIPTEGDEESSMESEPARS